MIKKTEFSLIEMLVVIAIIAILASLLVPALQNSLESARSMMCMNNMKQISMGAQVFATDNNGRFPGRYYYLSGSSLRDETWNVILEKAVFNEEEVIPIRVELPAKLTCPSHDVPPVTNRGSMVYAMNKDAVGGPNSGAGADASLPGSGSRGKGAYGVYVDTIPEPFASIPNILKYSLGAPIVKFIRPSYQFLFTEIDRSGLNLSYPAFPWSADGSLMVADDPEYPDYCSHSGQFSFRHPCLTANFVFIDGHAQTLDFTKEINAPARFKIEP